jgi:hypothetical protein
MRRLGSPIGIHIGHRHKARCWNIRKRRKRRTISNRMGLAHEARANETDTEFFHVVSLELNAYALFRAHVSLIFLLFLHHGPI